MLGGVVEEAGDFAEGALDDFFDRFVLPLRALGQIVAGGHVGLVVFVMMEFEGFARHMRGKCVIWIRQFGQGECHWSTPQCKSETDMCVATVTEGEWFL